MPGQHVNTEVKAERVIPEWSQDGYDPVKVTLRLIESESGSAWVFVRVDCLPRGTWWRIPSSSNLRRWVDQLIAYTDWVRKGPREETTPRYMQHWAWRYDLTKRAR